MDFLDPAKKRAHNRRLFIGYILVGVTIVLTSLILLILSNGYDVDRKTGQIIQNGLLFTSSEPESADIYLNGKSNGQTDKRLTVPAGHYDVEFRRSGYHTWEKSIELDGGSIERLVYARMFPEKISQATSLEFSGIPTFSTQSPDRRWIIVAEPGSVLDYTIFDSANPAQSAKSFSLPRTLLTVPDADKTETVKVVEWSSDNRHVLIEHGYGDKTEFIMVDREEASSSININSTLSINPTEISLRDKRFDRLYVYDGPSLTLSVADTKAKTVTPLIQQVIDYKSYGANVLLYSARDDTKPGKTLVKLWDNDKPYTVKVLEESEMLLDLAKYDGSWYVAAASVKEGKLYIFKDPFDRLKADKPTAPTVFAVMKIATPTKVAFSANTRFVSVQSAGHFVVYDFEENDRYNFTIPGTVPPTEAARWMDGHRLLLTQDGKVVVFEFDGQNRQTLTTIIPGSLPYFDRDYERLFSLSPAKDDATKASLVRSSLKVDLKP